MVGKLALKYSCVKHNLTNSHGPTTSFSQTYGKNVFTILFLKLQVIFSVYGLKGKRVNCMV